MASQWGCGVRCGMLCPPQPGWEMRRTLEGHVYYTNLSESISHHGVVRYVSITFSADTRQTQWTDPRLSSPSSVNPSLNPFNPMVATPFTVNPYTTTHIVNPSVAAHSHVNPLVAAPPPINPVTVAPPSINPLMATSGPVVQEPSSPSPAHLPVRSCVCV